MATNQTWKVQVDRSEELEERLGRTSIGEEIQNCVAKIIIN